MVKSSRARLRKTEDYRRNRRGNVLVALAGMKGLGAVMVAGAVIGMSFAGSMVGQLGTPSPSASSGQGLEVGTVAPDFTLTSLDGDSVKLSSFRGKPVFLNFWATWCPPCRAEMPDMSKVKAEMGDTIHIVGVNLKETPDKVKPFVTENGYDWLHLLDSDGAIGKSYGVHGIPASYFLDAEGVIVGKQVGGITSELMTLEIEKAKNR